MVLMLSMPSLFEGFDDMMENKSKKWKQIK